ncbi:hypothetical protein [Streptomyces qinglanensis]|uniref:hypothetical protein n=1 Tax=Streptomyces qinglanensis TaxID=943816 RepID=UPI0037B7965F
MTNDQEADASPPTMHELVRQVFREVFMTRLAETIGPVRARERAIADLRAGAVPPWDSDEIDLTIYLARERLRKEIPEPEKTGGRLYVLGFQGLRPVVKVGSTGSPERQFDKYEVQARNFGYALVDGWVSAPVGTREEAYKQESLILENLHFVLNGYLPGGRIFEWFHGHGFERIRELVKCPEVLLQQRFSRYQGDGRPRRRAEQ